MLVVTECTKLAWAKKLKLGWLGSARRQGQCPGLALRKLEIVLNFRAELGKSEIYELSGLGLGGNEHFDLYPIRPIWIKTISVLL